MYTATFKEYNHAISLITPFIIPFIQIECINKEWSSPFEMPSTNNRNKILLKNIRLSLEMSKASLNSHLKKYQRYASNIPLKSELCFTKGKPLFLSMVSNTLTSKGNSK